MGKRVGKYDVHRTLGEGSFGKVKMAVDTETGAEVAIKILDKEKIQQQNMGAQIKEISIMKMIAHPHVVKLHEVLASKTKIFIVLELVTGGELFDHIVKAGRFDEKTARFYWSQLINGIKHCHDAGVAHRDLKPENLLLDGDGNLKITDFGLSALYTSAPGDETRTTLLHTTCGTPNYVAPEVLVDKGYDGRAADIWSCGVILYVMLAGFLPFDEPHMSALFRKIQKAEYSYPGWFSADARSLLDKILVPDPTKRVTVADIQNHAWFKAGVAADAGSVPGGEAAPQAAPLAKAVSASAAARSTDADAEKFVVPVPSLRGAMMAQAATLSSAEPEGGDGEAEDDASPLESRPVVSEPATAPVNAFGVLAELSGATLRGLVARPARPASTSCESELSITSVIAAVKAAISHFPGLQLAVGVVESGTARMRVTDVARSTVCVAWASAAVDAPGSRVTVVDTAGTHAGARATAAICRAVCA